ncbi:MAG: hypothetical protein EAZ67_04210 [Cytophagales bacterium]|nr:MAG: hypothetical protein EAZ67_04210 [Cytophagales bacterium]
MLLHIKTLQYCILFWMLAVCNTVWGQAKKATIPFELTSFNNMSIKAVLNRTDTIRLMFHTGAMDLTLTEEAVKKLKSLDFDQTISGIKSWGGTSGEARVSQNNLLAIDKLQWDSLTITENKHSGQFTDGKFGLDLFKDKFVEIDFEKQILNITARPPKTLKRFEKHTLSYENGLMFIEASCGIEQGSNAMANQFLIHSGYAGGLLLDDEFTSSNKLGEKLKTTEQKELKDSYGNVMKTNKAILPIFKIGSFVLPNVSVGFFEGAIGRQKISVMGGDILKRFNWVIDAKREFIYLKPNANYNLPMANFF